MTKFIILFLSMFLIISEATAQNNRIVWEKDYKKSLAAARQTHKPVLIYFTAPKCESCREADEQFWETDKVAAEVKLFITVKIDAETEKSVAAKYNVTAAPFFAFTDPLGNLISFQKVFDKNSPRRLNTALKDITKDFSSLEKSYQAIERKKDDGGALLAIADSYRGWGIIFLSSEFYRKALKTPEIQANAKEKERAAFALGINAVGYRDYKQAVELLEDYLADYPQGMYLETALTLLIVGNANLEKFNDSEKYLARLKTDFPKSKNIAVALKAIENAKNKPQR